MFKLIATVLLLHATEAWVLEASHTRIYANMPTNVNLKCYYGNDDNGQKRMGEVFRISLHKFQKDRSLMKIVEVHYAHGPSGIEVSHAVNSTITAIGHAEYVGNSFLTITWSHAFPDALGEYLCIINGITDDDKSVIVNTDPVTLVQTQCSANALLTTTLVMAKQFEQREKIILNAFGRIQNGTCSNTDDNTLIEKVKEDLKAMKKETADRLKIALADIDQLCQSQQECSGANNTGTRTTPEATEWPEGVYILPNPIHGCPQTRHSAWNETSAQYYTESSTDANRSRNQLSQPNHLAQPVFLNRDNKDIFIYLTCEHRTNTSTLAWPNGSYCIGRLGPSCPPGFKHGQIRLDLEDDTVSQDLRLDFCCQSLGDHDRAMVLPVAKPFFLYSFRGKCQAVLGTVVTREWMVVDTEHTSNGDSHPFHPVPDGSLNPFLIYMCYYERQA